MVLHNCANYAVQFDFANMYRVTISALTILLKRANYKYYYLIFMELIGLGSAWHIHI